MKFRFCSIITLALLSASANASLSDSEKNKLLKLHQETRSEVGASNMQHMSWSSTLAGYAQKYADECNGMIHCRKKYGSSCKGPAENLAKNSLSSSVETMFNQWKSEKSDFLKAGVVDHYKGGDWGHYSQIVWAKATEVGCGVAKCNDHKLLVCKYNTGNVSGQQVYAGGKKGSSDNNNKKATTTSSKKATSTSTVVVKKTTTTVKATKSVPTSKAVNPAIGNATKNITPGHTKILANGPSGTNSTVLPNQFASPLNNTQNINGTLNNANTTSIKTNINTNTNTNANTNKIVDIDKSKKNEKDSTPYVTGFAISGGVIGAAAISLILAKKNPKQYENIKRSITKKATTVKRGMTRKFSNNNINAEI